MGGLNCAKVACPQSHHIWRPPAAGSPCSRCPHPFPSCSLSHFPDGGDVFQQAVICVWVLFATSLLFAQEEQQGGVNEGWRDRSSKVLSLNDDTTDSYELWAFLCGVRTFCALPLTVAAPDPETIVGEILPSVPACVPTLIVHSQQTHSFAFPFSYLAFFPFWPFFPCFVVPHPCIFPGPCSSTEIQAWEAKRRAGQQRTQKQRDSCWLRVVICAAIEGVWALGLCGCVSAYMPEGAYLSWRLLLQQVPLKGETWASKINIHHLGIRLTSPKPH